MVIGGFAANEIELVPHGSALLVSGQKGEPRDSKMLHHGIPSTSFKQTSTSLIM